MRGTRKPALLTSLCIGMCACRALHAEDGTSGETQTQPAVAAPAAAVKSAPTPPPPPRDPPRFYNNATGEPLDFSELEETETPAVLAMKQTGRNLYNTDPAAIKEGGSLFSTACSGCHGHEAEGKLGPGLADDYWTYSANVTDAGFFSSVFGGLQGQMGPQKNRLTQDQILHVMAWVRSIYKGDPAKASWLE